MAEEKLSTERERSSNDSSRVEKKSKRRDKSDLGADFVAPDGGWGWVVCFAAGLSTFSLFPPVQQYGILYRERMYNLGFNGKQITSIINIELATSTLIGIVNGAMFRRFTFRQVALTGGLLVFIGIALSAFCETFIQFVLCFSLIYGIGLGMNTSATALAVNTYFKKYRRRATGLTWTTTGLGPIIFPHITTFLLKIYGVQGAVLIIAAISLNTLVCGSTLQPVLWHVKPKKKDQPPQQSIEMIEDIKEIENTKESFEEADYLCKYCQYHRDGNRNIFSSQYLFNDDDPERPGFEMTDPVTPKLARANDGWFGSQTSLRSKVNEGRNELRHRTVVKNSNEIEYLESGTPNPPEKDQSNYFNREREDRERYSSGTSLHSKLEKNLSHCTCIEDRALLKRKLSENLKAQEEFLRAEEDRKQKMSFKEKIVKFFDLDLLRDWTFVNLVQGMTIMMFGEMNFSFLTPFILGSYNYTNEQISLAMSLMGGMDIIFRLIGPFLLEKVKFSNSQLFACGIVIITIARFFVTMVDSYYVMLGLFMMIGFGKSFRTIFAPLIIPSYVPINRLPAASGLQLVCNTIFSLAFGPVLGIIADISNYKVVIHFLNLTSMIALLFWVLEWYIRRRSKKSAKNDEVN